ncbi:MAG: serine/threonine-protein kinase [Myxococcota bacterium]
MLPAYGSFETIKRLAVGGMGEIFLARQTGLKGFERLAIIKTLLSQPEDDDDRVDMFLAEARIAGMLNHPNIVQIYDVNQEEGTYYIAMEYVDGDTLSSLVRAALRQGRHNPWPFLAFVAQAARALHHAHHQADAQGHPLHLVHRDVSPQNIMVRRDGVTKVVDFGIAKVAGGGQRTRTGVMKGKVAYMAPEQMRAEAVDARSDLFALGVVAWEVTAGRRMFPNKSDVEIISAVMTGQLPRPSDVVPAYPQALERVVMRALAADPAQRFQTGNEMAAALEEVLAAVPASEKPEPAAYVESLIGDAVRERLADLTPASRTGSRTSVRKKRRQLLSVLGGAGVAAAGMAALWLSRPAPSAPPPTPPAPVVAAPAPAPAPAPVPVVQPAIPDAGVVEAKAPEVEPARTKAPGKGPKRGGRGGETRPEPAPVGGDGFLTLASDPWAVVTVDGNPMGSTPLFKVRLPAGRHTVKLVNEAQGLTRTFTVDIKPGEVAKREINLR